MAWLRKFVGIGKILLTLAVLMIVVFAIGHFGLQYGIGIGDVPKFLEQTWAIWLIIRWAMYAVAGYFLWKISKLPVITDGNEADRKQYHKLVHLAIIAVICIEVIVFARLFGG